MENWNFYFLNILSNDSTEDKFSWEDLELETIYNLNIGDIIDLRNEKYSTDIKNEFNTTLFIIVNRRFIADSNNSLFGGVIILELKAYSSINLYKNIRDMEVDAFRFSVRALNVMHAQDIFYIKDLLDYTFNRENFGRNWGDKTKKEVFEFIDLYKLR